MALDTYVHFIAALQDHLAGTTLTTSNLDDCITLFEADASSELFRIRGSETTTILVPTMPAAISVTGAANNGSGLIRLTITATSTLTSGQELAVGSVGGTTEANGTWIITVIDATNVDLRGSTFANTYTSGGTVQGPQGTCSLPTDYMGWRRATWTGTPVTEMKYVHPTVWATEFNTFFPLTQADPPQVFTIEGSTFKVMPPTSTPIEFDYYARDTAASSTLDFLFTNYVNVYWNGVLAEVYRYTKDYEQAAGYAAERDSIYKGIKMQQFREDGALTIRATGSNYGQTP